MRSWVMGSWRADQANRLNEIIEHGFIPGPDAILVHWGKTLDSTPQHPRLASDHVHAQSPHNRATCRTASDQAAGHGEHERDH